ncbi:Coagulation factor XI [Triplophysa tibetana]|uniref:Coagulation factor XI n=1 Tax=Triplophysa tibetana TaxID=1572043 RepID=A0A5A9P6K0_9TELE|nr:Coagulation factor XI [Triplophysa tibetana]
MVASLGRQCQTGPNPNEISIGVDKVYIHPRYKSSSQDNDIALVKLSSIVNFTDYIRPVCLAGANSSIAAGTESWVTGWGKLSFEADDNTSILQVASVQITKESDCKHHSCFPGLTDNMICAGKMQGSKADACQGDSGGPLVSMNNNSQWIQSGIALSVSQMCAEKPPSTQDFLDGVMRLQGLGLGKLAYENSPILTITAEEVSSVKDGF